MVSMAVGATSTSMLLCPSPMGTRMDDVRPEPPGAYRSYAPKDEEDNEAGCARGEKVGRDNELL